MMTWNYRVVRKENPGEHLEEERYSFGIHEVYYNDNGTINACTVEPMDPHGMSLDELRACMDLMMGAFDKPVLDYETDIPGSSPRTSPELADLLGECDAQDGC